ncbi:MAG: hypothetical protein HY324_02745, partial [Chlamydiia bacterium]|nr:hypothetical protein [Chlamydiia bacterium]
MRFLPLLFVTLFLSSSAFWVWNYVPAVKGFAEDMAGGNTFQTLEVRYTAETIMDLHRQELLADDAHVFLAPTLKFVPYLLMDVKYIRTQDKTGEGIILWGLVDGEMVVNTSTWERTHGFTDCIAANASKQEFKIINALSSRGGALDRDG